MATATAAIQSLDKLHSALITKFPPFQVDKIFFCFNKLRSEARRNHWYESMIEGGKFVEAVLKCFHYLHTTVEIEFVNIDEEIRHLEQTTNLSDFERLTMPHALRLMYEICNKRGGVHSTSFDPIQIDCVLVVAVSKWIMEELTRLYLTNDALAAQKLIESLLIKDTSLVEEMDGDLLVLRPGLSARVQIEILLWKEFPNRCSTKDLAQWMIHNHSIENIRTTLRTMRQKNLVHETDDGWKLTDSGMDEADTEVVKLQDGIVNATTSNKSRTKGARRGRK